MSEWCKECGEKTGDGISYEPHSDSWHRAKRRILMRVIRRRLVEELTHRRVAETAAKYDCILLMWRVVMPTEVLYFHDLISGEFWEERHPLRAAMLADMGRGHRDAIEAERGLRVHPSRVTCRVFDEREK